MAQAVGDAAAKHRACSSLTHAERAACVDRLAGELSSETAGPRTTFRSSSPATPDGWVLSETTSPIDYSPVVIATTTTASGAPDGTGMKLSIACRGGNTSLALTALGVLPTAEGYSVSYAVDRGPPTMLPATVMPSRTGIALGADAVRLLVSLPAQGEVAFRIVGRQGEAFEGRYSLAGVQAIRERMAVSCKSPTKPDSTRKQ